MKRNPVYALAAVGLGLLAWGCATSGPTPAEPPPEPGQCQDRSRLGYPENLRAGQERLARLFLNDIAPEGAEVRPLSGPRPDILNRYEVSQALVREYPRALRSRRVGGTAQVAFFFDERGRLELIRVIESTGHEELDQAAARVAGVIHFSVNQLGDPPACWATVLPVTFTTR